MNWYYVDGEKQAGPVDDAQLEGLLRDGRIQLETLVWHEGMANWQPYSEVRPPPPAPPLIPVVMADSNEAVCAECGKIFNKENMIRYGEAHVCAACKPIFLQKLAEGAKVSTGAFNYAGFWIRFGAKVVDSLILGIIFGAPLFILGFHASISNRSPAANGGFPFFLLFQIGVYGAGMAYQVFFLGKYGATPGKMFCKLKVITADGGKISYLRATGRFFAEMLSGMICYIGYIIVGFDEQKRALHDHICNTRVVYK